ncbi:MAG: glycosyltransferase [Anaerolineae bacterium]|jgi:glycosyltransferase involved in cell wall biosynthesis
MSGPGIRYWEFARTLSRLPSLDVSLVTTPGSPAQLVEGPLPFRLLAGRDEAYLHALAQAADVLVAPGAVVSLYPSLLRAGVPLALDLYIPLLLEELQRQTPHTLDEQGLQLDRVRTSLLTQIRAADFILCASEKQRDYWLGALAAAGRINPHTRADDPTLRHMIDVVPFGLPAEPPQHTRPVLKGVVPGIGVDDRVLLWGGGLYDWLDAPTLVRAMARLAPRRPDVKLLFMGTQHPNPRESQRRGTRETLALADELELTGRTVFFNDWVPYAERANYLLEADVGVSLHRDHLETRFSFRTRFLDILWTGLPVVATRGDVFGELVEREALGRVVAPGDVDGVAEAIVALLDTPDLRQVYRARFERVAEAYRWEHVIGPLAAFCSAPQLAPDRAYLEQCGGFGAGPTPWWRLPGKAWRALRAGGLRGLARQIGTYRRWMRGRRGKS